jgi:two-component system LytT family response regulator
MLSFLAIDDTHCKKELASFIKKQERSVKLMANPHELMVQINRLMEGSVTVPAKYRKLAVNTTESITLLNIHEIVRCESHRNYTFIHLVNKEKLIASKTLMDFEEVLARHHFLRIHKSHLININYMDKYVKSEGGYVMLSDGAKLPVAVRKKEYLFRILEKL